MKTPTKLLVLLASIAAAGCLVAGCGNNAGKAAKAFDSANPEVKTLWVKAQTAAKTRDYATAILTFQQLHAQTNLSQEQIKALEQTATAVSDQMYEASNKGDPAAEKAIETLRKARGR